MARPIAHEAAAVVLVLSALAVVEPARAADPAAGKKVFAAQCMVCHSGQKGRNLVGPSLFGIFNSKTGSVIGFSYSPANLKANLVWDEATLDKYLKAPDAVIPDTTMGFAGLPSDVDRANLIAYLATLK